jgi:hypothetical protein
MANNITVRDVLGNDRVMAAIEIEGALHPAHVFVDNSGAVGELLNPGAAVDANSVPTAPSTEVAAPHGAAAGSRPMGVAGRARTSFDTAVDNADAAGVMVDKFGRVITRSDAPEDLGWVSAPIAGGIVAIGDTVLVPTAPGASLRRYIKSVQISIGSLSAATELVIKDAAGGAILWRCMLPNGVPMIAVPIHFDRPLACALNGIPQVAILTAATGGVFLNAQGYTGPGSNGEVRNFPPHPGREVSGGHARSPRPYGLGPDEGAAAQLQCAYAGH